MNAEEEAALRAALAPRAEQKAPKAVSLHVVFHALDWAAFFRGLESYAGRRGWACIRRETDGPEEIIGLNDFLDDFERIPYNCCCLVFGPEWDGFATAPVAERREFSMRAHCLNVLGGGISARIGHVDAAYVYGHHYSDDKEKAAFLRAAKRIAAKVATRSVVLHETYGDIRTPDAKFGPDLYGFALAAGGPGKRTGAFGV